MQEININELKPHPRNTEFFDDMSGEKWSEFKGSVKSRLDKKNNGEINIEPIIEPLIVTTNMIVVSGHQRLRACKELGISTVKCEIRKYDSDDDILKDLIETNIRQRGDVGGSAKKVGLRIKELEHLYGIRNGSIGGTGKNQYSVLHPNYSDEATPQQQLAKMCGMSVDTLNNYKKLTEMIPELEELVDTGITTPTTALAIMRNLSESEQLELISSMNTTKKITQREIQKYIDEKRELEIRVKELESQSPETKIIDNTNYSSISKLENEIKDLKMQKNMLERKVKLNQEDSDKYNKLKSDIDFLSKRKSDLGRQIDSATELSGLTVRLQRLLEEELAPIKFKRCIEVLDSSDVCVSNLQDIISKIDNWSFEMRTLLTNNYDNVVDVK